LSEKVCYSRKGAHLLSLVNKQLHNIYDDNYFKEYLVNKYPLFNFNTLFKNNTSWQFENKQIKTPQIETPQIESSQTKNQQIETQ
jgi:hypothetical protein